MQVRISDVLSAVIEVTGIRSNPRRLRLNAFGLLTGRVLLATDATRCFR